MLLIFDLQSCMASLISLIIGMEILVITYIGSYFITSELLTTMIITTIIIMMMVMISTIIIENSTEKLEKMT